MSMNKSDLDISYITSRLAVMSYPAEGVESAFKNHIEDVRSYLDSRHANCYAVYNLSNRSYRSAKFQNRVSECGWKAGKAPPLILLYSVCKNMHLFLRQNPKNICIIHCLDGRTVSGTVVVAFLCFCHLFQNVTAAVNMFTVKRIPPALIPSQKRYIEYICDMAASDNNIPHYQIVEIHQIKLEPVPIFNKTRNGCRPFLEIYVGEERILSTSQEYDQIRGFLLEDEQVVLPTKVSVCGDITVVIYHARATLGGKVQGKLTSMKICQIQFHSGFLQQNSHLIQFTKFELDYTDSADKYPDDFTVSVHYTVTNESRAPAQKLCPWNNFSLQSVSSKILFSSRDEQHLVLSEFGDSDRSKNKLGRSGTQFTSTDDETVVGHSNPGNENFVKKQTVQYMGNETDLDQKQQAPGQRSSGGKSLLDTLEWHESNQSMLSNQSTDEDQPKIPSVASIDEEFASFTVNRTVTQQQKFFGEKATVANQNICSDGFNSFKHSGTIQTEDLLNIESGNDSHDLFKSAASKTSTQACSAEMANTDTSGSDVKFFDDNEFGLFQTSADRHAESNNSGTTCVTSNPFNPFGSELHSETDEFLDLETAVAPSEKLDIFATPSLDTSHNTADVTAQLTKDSQPNQKAEDEFLKFMESTSEPNQNDDLMGNWNTTNIISGGNISMPRPSSQGSLASGSSGVIWSSGAAGARQNQTSQKFDPLSEFGNLGGLKASGSSSSFQSKNLSRNASGASISSEKSFVGGTSNQATHQSPSKPSYYTSGFSGQAYRPPQGQPVNNSGSHGTGSVTGQFASVIGHRDDRGIKKPFESNQQFGHPSCMGHNFCFHFNLLTSPLSASSLFRFLHFTLWKASGVIFKPCLYFQCIMPVDISVHT